MHQAGEFGHRLSLKQLVKSSQFLLQKDAYQMRHFGRESQRKSSRRLSDFVRTLFPTDSCTSASIKEDLYSPWKEFKQGFNTTSELLLSTPEQQFERYPQHMEQISPG